MEEAAQLCDRVLIMDEGRIIARGTPQGLIEEHIGAEVVELYSTDASHSHAIALLQGAADHVERAGDEVFGFFRQSESARALLPDLAEHHVVHRRATLEDVFLRLTGRELRE
jgi:lipooligosaccharide transport system ATP-binding protein